MRILAIDIGSSAIKAAVYDGRRFSATARVAYPTRFEGDRVEIDPGRLITTLFKAIKQTEVGAGPSPDAIAFCTFSPGIVVMDGDGRPTTPIITHADRRSTQMAAELVRRHGKAFWLKHAGNLPYPGSIGASTLAFLRRRARNVFPKNYRVGQASTLMAHALTGIFTIDPSQAVFLGLYDIHTGAWNEHLCQAANVDPCALPAIHAADSVLGKVSEAAARRIGLAGGIPVVGGFVDTSAAILQTPMHAGQLTHSAGSTDVLAMCLDKPRPAEGILTRPVGVGAILPERWLAVRTIASAGSAIAWARQAFFRELSESAWHKLLDETCARRGGGDSPPVDCVPTFAGERAAIVQPAGASFGHLHLGSTREQLLESLVFALARQSGENYQMLRKIHAPGRTVYSMGGASSLGSAMHRAWPHRRPTHHFTLLANDNLPGLVLLAEKALHS